MSVPCNSTDNETHNSVTVNNTTQTTHTDNEETRTDAIIRMGAGEGREAEGNVLDNGTKNATLSSKDTTYSRDKDTDKGDDGMGCVIYDFAEDRGHGHRGGGGGREHKQ